MNWIQKILIKNYEKKILQRIERDRQRAEKSKQEAIQQLLELNKIYIIEDNQGREYTKERLQTMNHKQLLQLLEHFTEELRKEYGETK